MTQPEDTLRNHLRDLGQHLLDLSGVGDASEEAATKPAIPLSPYRHKPEFIDDRAFLCQLAREEYHERQRRKSFLDEAFLGEPAWNILLDLFVNYALERRIAVSSACYAADVPVTTALRYVDLMEERGLVVRIPDGNDKRRNWIELTPQTYEAMAKYLVERGKVRRADGVSFVGTKRAKF
jgi:DNA-binding MarR family transcriptional regulator